MEFLSCSSVSKHQDGGMYKTPTYPGYPFLMLPDPYLPNSSVSPSVSAPPLSLSCWLKRLWWWFLVWAAAGWAAWGLYPRLCFNVLALDSSASLEHFSFYLVSSPNTEHMFLVFRGSFIWWAFWIIATAGAERHAGMEMFRARRVFCICGRRNQILSSRSLIKNKKENSDGKRWRLLWPFFWIKAWIFSSGCFFFFPHNLRLICCASGLANELTSTFIRLKISGVLLVGCDQFQRPDL